MKVIKFATRLLFISALISPLNVNAQLAPGPDLDPFNSVMDLGTGLSVPVRDNYVLEETTNQTRLEWVNEQFWKAYEKGKDVLSETASIAYRVGVRTLIRQIANDVGEWIGSGGKGQSSLYFSDGWDTYLRDAADTASGAMIDQIISDGYLGAFGVCNPSFDLQLRINLGVTQFDRPAVRCKFSELRNNWQTAIRSQTFLPDLRDSFNAGENDLGIALTVQSNLLRQRQEASLAAQLSREEGRGIKGVLGPISDSIITPAKTVGDFTAETIGLTLGSELSPTGEIVSDSVDVFLNAVARGFVTSLTRGCFFGNCPNDSDGNSRADLFNPDAQRGVEGVVAAKARLAQQINPSFAVPGRYNVVSELVSCPTPSNPGPKECVIDDDFATAINRRLTVRQAVEEGLISGDRPFGFVTRNPQPTEPNINDGIPYRSILALRTQRIVPVGWEIAARYIGSYDTKIVTLNELMQAYDNNLPENPYYRLVDPNWVLMSPDAFCKLSGPGAQIVNSRVQPGQDGNNDGDFDDPGEVKPQLIISRDGNYCADEQTCIQRDDSGACKFYGYCLEERPSLEFKAASCEPRFSTCTTLENMVSGTTVSYLLNTVDFANCDAGSVGCQQYATWQRLDVSTDSELRWNLDRADLRPVYLNNQTDSCEQGDAGCRAYIRLEGLSDVNGQEQDTKINEQLSAVKTDPTDDFEANSSTVHLKRAPEWMGCRGCQAASLGDGDKTIVDITDINVVNNLRSTSCTNNPATSIDESKVWPCDDGSVSTEDLEQVAIAFEQGTCSTECRAYAPYCSAAQVGCMAYTPTNGNPAITAVSGLQCPSQCVGFDSYTRIPTFFEPNVRVKPFIPSSARSCQVSEAGCTAFTNLTKEGQGGEAREYYQALRLCQLPNQDTASVYYTWEGSDDTGFQLRSFELKVSNLDGAPCTNLNWTNGTTADCSDDANNIAVDACNANNYQQNPDCRQFYTVGGDVSYRLLSKTIVIDESCTPLRKTKTVEDDITQQEACNLTSGYWNGSACIYQALTSQSKSCSANAAGCRLYQGGTSANYQPLLSIDFETDAEGFEGGRLSAVSSSVGGHSYAVSGTATLPLVLSTGQTTTRDTDVAVAPGRYRVSFYARKATPGAAKLTVDILNTNITDQEVDIDDTWRLVELDEVFPENENAELSIGPLDPTGVVYIDNVTVTTSVDTFAVIDNSWSTPTQCYIDGELDDPMLGCQAYNTTSKGTQNIYEFGNSCEPKFIGCEALIDTQNTTTGENPYSEIYYPNGSTKQTSEVFIEEDVVDYVVNQSRYRCNGTKQGCMAVGLSDTDVVTNKVKWSTQYLLNNPDRYSSILCGVDDVSCSAFSGGGTTYYFKDPKNKLCEYRTDRPVQGWYRKGSIAVSPDCEDGQVLRTFAPGKIGKGPGAGWVGSCPAVANSCTEYIDPRSDGQPNLLQNGSFIIGQGTQPTNWTGTSVWQSGSIVVSNSNRVEQSITLNGSTLYTVSADVQSTNIANQEPAFLGVSCLFNSSMTLAVQCDNLGTGTDVDDATANLNNGCPQSGVCIGDLNDDRRVDANEVVAFEAIKSGALQSSCGAGNYVDISASPDNSYLPIFWGGNPARFGGGTVLKPDEQVGRMSFRFYLPLLSAGQTASCNVILSTGNVMPNTVANDWTPATSGIRFTNASLREGGVYYQLANRVDKSSCSGNANNTDCVYLNERLVNTATLNNGQTRVDAVRGYQSLQFDSDNSSGAVVDGTCADTGFCSRFPSRSCRTNQDCGVNLDANTVVKVTPTRECNAWLSCRTTRTVVQNGVTKQVCLEVESCLAINDKGECIRRAPEQSGTDLVFDRTSVDRIKNLSGYSRVGFNWSGGVSQSIPGQLPIAQMTQAGQAVPLINGNFELFSPDGEPVGWTGWNNGDRMKVISDPVTAGTKSGVEYPLEGRAFLEVNANGALPSDQDSVTDLLPVAQGSQYILSAYLNTLQLSGADARVSVLRYGSNRQLIPDTTGTNFLSLAQGFGWERRVLPFTIPVGTEYIRLQLTESVAASAGYWFIDDVQLRPALEIRNDYYEPQSCKLYPAEDAPSCDYFTDQGLRATGKRGYCLTPDPTNKNYCLQWWPVDSVYGEDSGEDRAGYDGPVPLYYCADTSDGWIQASTITTGAGNEAKPTGEVLISSVSQSGIFSEITESDDIALNDDKFKLVIDTYRSADSTRQYAIGGMIDKPGGCKAVGGGVVDTVGCELKVHAEEGGGQDDYEVYVSNSPGGFPRYLVYKWKDPGAAAPPTQLRDIPDSSNTGQHISYIDIGWARDDNFQPVNGPFRYIIFDRENTEQFVEIQGLFVRPVYSCNVIVSTVSSDGQSMGYVSRLSSGTTSTAINLSPSTQVFRATPQPPYGSAIPPVPIDYPTNWDTMSLVSGNQPLFPLPYSERVVSAGVPYGCELQSSVPSTPAFGSVCGFTGGTVSVRSPDDAISELLGSLFVKTYGIWEWKEVAGEYGYQVSSTLQDLIPPTTPCTPTGIRPATGQPCGIAPEITEVRLNGGTSNVVVNNIGTVSLSFTTNVDVDQLPIVAYRVRWGDGTETVQSGLRLQNRRTQENAITLTHNYSADQLARGGCTPVGGCTPLLGGYVIRPSVQIVDNWGWCNGDGTVAGRTGYHISSGSCSSFGWRPSGAVITVRP